MDARHHDPCSEVSTRLQNEYEARRVVERHREHARQRAKKSPVSRNLRKSVTSKPCRVCGNHRTEAHHIVPRASFRRSILSSGLDVHDPSNLMPLCHQCHQNHHTKGRDGRVPRRCLEDHEVAFVLAVKSPAWLDAWYPCR